MGKKMKGKISGKHYDLLSREMNSGRGINVWDQWPVHFLRNSVLLRKRISLTAR
jgi:hypothetical protein